MGGHGGNVDTRGVTPHHGNLSVVENALPIVFVALEEFGESFPGVVSIFVSNEVVAFVGFETEVYLHGSKNAVLSVAGQLWRVL